MSAIYPYGSMPYGAAPTGTAPTVTSSTERFLILSPRESDAATLVASSQETALPVANLQNMQPAKVWRATSATPQSITLDFGYPVAANALALVGHNLTDAGMLRVRGATTQAAVTASPAVDASGSAWPVTGKPVAQNWPHHTSLLRWSNDLPYQYWQVDIADGGSVLTYIEVGRLMLGRAFQPTVNFDFGGQPLSFETADIQTRTPYGRTFTDRRTISPPRNFEVTVYAMTKREAFDGLAELQRLRGTWGDVVCALDPGDSTDFHRFTMQGVFGVGGAYTLPIAFDSDGNMFGAGIRLREVI